jgi:hypothetical protein
MKSASSGMTLENGGPAPPHVAVSQHRRCAEAASSPTALLRAGMSVMCNSPGNRDLSATRYVPSRVRLSVNGVSWWHGACFAKGHELDDAMPVTANKRGGSHSAPVGSGSCGRQVSIFMSAA